MAVAGERKRGQVKMNLAIEGLIKEVKVPTAPVGRGGALGHVGIVESASE
jgi:hypothetical protein